MPSALSSRRATRESSATTSDASRSTSSARSVMSRRLPSGVGTNTRPMSSSASPSPTVVRRIELRGHILDSGIFNRVLGVLTDHERAAYVIEEFDSGRTKVDPSYARLAIEAGDPDYLDELIDKLREQGAEVMEEGDAETEAAPADGVLPDQFYATTNYATDVRVNGAWLPVANPEMDSAIVLD